MSRSVPPAFSFRAMATMLCSPIPYTTRSAFESSTIDRFTASDQ
jgi:hypothetical protein